eukprot:scaffold13.g236.t1
MSYYPGSGEDVASSTFDVAVSDGERAWTATGVSASTLQGATADKMERAVAGLSSGLLEGPVAEEQYSHEVQQRGEDLAIRVRWTPPGKFGYLQLALTAKPALDPREKTAAMLDLLVRNVDVLQAACAQLQRDGEELKRMVDSSGHLVEEYVKNKTEQDRQNAVKIAALLNSKKAKVRELQARVEALTAQLASGGAAIKEEEGVKEEKCGEGKVGPMQTDGGGSSEGQEEGQDEEDRSSEEADWRRDSREQSPERDMDRY